MTAPAAIKRFSPSLSLKDRLELACIPEPMSGCWLWLKTGEPYGTLKWQGRDQKAHRLSWKVFKGDIHPKMRVLHRCDTPACINPDHLFLGTQADNVKDMFAKGRNHLQKGSGNGRSVLTELDASSIRQSSLPSMALSSMYGVSTTTIRAVRSGRVWKHI